MAMSRTSTRLRRRLAAVSGQGGHNGPVSSLRLELIQRVLRNTSTFAVERVAGRAAVEQDRRAGDGHDALPRSGDAGGHPRAGRGGDARRAPASLSRHRGEDRQGADARCWRAAERPSHRCCDIIRPARWRFVGGPVWDVILGEQDDRGDRVRGASRTDTAFGPSDTSAAAGCVASGWSADAL